MKKFYLIGGTMGVGKTAVCQHLKRKLPKAVFLDGDWCWDADPFQVTSETKEMVMNNICYLLNSYIHCSVYENIIFCWVMHEQSIIETILHKIDSDVCDIKVISLLATRETLSERIMGDVAKGIRSVDVLERSISKVPLYKSIDSIKIESDGKSIPQIATEIIQR